jgi:SLOG cluster4 family
VVTQYDAEARTVGAAIIPGPRLVVIGSASFWGHDSRQLCEAIAVELAEFAALVALTGGMDGVGLTFGRAFAAARRAAARPENLFHLLPRGMGPCDSGVTLGAGIDYHGRREVLGRVGHAYLVIEGGPGTAHEAAVAAGRGVPVIPLARTGGHAGELYARAGCPSKLPRADWDCLADAAAPHGPIVAAVGRLVRLALAGQVNESFVAGGASGEA